jgi:hypothetical protein
MDKQEKCNEPDMVKNGQNESQPILQIFEEYEDYSEIRELLEILIAINSEPQSYYSSR